MPPVTKTATAGQADCCHLGDAPACTITNMATRKDPKTARLYIAEWLAKDGRGDAELAKLVKVARQTVWRWRTGERGLKDVEKPRLAAVLGINPEDFFRHPDRPSIDGMLTDQPDDVVQEVAEMAAIVIRRRGPKKPSKSA